MFVLYIHLDCAMIADVFFFLQLFVSLGLTLHWCKATCTMAKYQLNPSVVQRGNEETSILPAEPLITRWWWLGLAFAITSNMKNDQAFYLPQYHSTKAILRWCENELHWLRSAHCCARLGCHMQQGASTPCELLVVSWSGLWALPHSSSLVRAQPMPSPQLLTQRKALLEVLCAVRSPRCPVENNSSGWTVVNNFVLFVFLPFWRCLDFLTY